MVSTLENISLWSGKITSALIFPMILIVVFSVIMRYVLKIALNWSFEVSIFVYGIYFMMGGAYCEWAGSHVAVDVLIRFLGPTGKKVLQTIIALVMTLSCAVLIYNSARFSLHSTLIGEHSIHQTAFNPPIWWFKWFIPISSFFIVLQGIAELLKIWFLKPAPEREGETA